MDELVRAIDDLRTQFAAHRTEVRDALAEAAARTVERERAVAAALEGLAGQLNQFTATLAAEVRRAGEDAVAELRTAASAIPAPEPAPSSNGVDPERALQALDGVAALTLRADPAPALERAVADLASIAARMERLADLPDRIARLQADVDTIARRPSGLDELVARVDDLRAHVHALVAARRDAAAAALHQLPRAPDP